MTNKEAIEWLGAIDKKYIYGGDEWYDEQRHEAIKTAIKALETVDQAHNTNHTCYTLSRNGDRCDVCGAILKKEGKENG